jgi:hypothetical protein
MSEGSLLAEKRNQAHNDRDMEEKREAERRKAEWEEVESSALGMGRMPEGKKRSMLDSTIGGVSNTLDMRSGRCCSRVIQSETTAYTAISGRTFGTLSTVESSDDGGQSDLIVTESITDGMEVATESEAGRYFNPA